MEKLRGREPSVSADFVTQIYELYDTGIYGYKRIAKALGTTTGTVLYYIRKRNRLQENEKAAATNEVETALTDER